MNQLNSINGEDVNNLLAQFAFQKKSIKRPDNSASQQKSQTNSNQNTASNITEPKSNSTKKRQRGGEDTLKQEADNTKLKKIKHNTEQSNNKGSDVKVSFIPDIPMPTAIKKVSFARKKKQNSYSDNAFNVFEVSEATNQDRLDEEDETDKPVSNRNGKGKKKGTKKEKEEKEENPDTEINIQESDAAFESAKLPEWAKDQNVRDKEGRSSGDKDYDPTKLYIPPKALDKMGTMMKKYWEIKSENYDKLVFIRLHSFYYVYHKDAYICHNELGSKLFDQLGFRVAYLSPLKITSHCQQLVEKNYKIILVEPTQEYESKDDVKLEIYQIITRGTFIDSPMTDYTAKYCLFLVEKGQNIGYAYVDTTTHEYFMGEFEDTPNKTQLRSLLLQVTPSEIVYTEKGISNQVLLMLKNLYWKPIVTSIPKTKPQGVESIIFKIKSYFKEESDVETLSNSSLAVLKELIHAVEETVASIRMEGKEVNEGSFPYFWTLQGINISLEYLEYLHLDDIVFSKCRFLWHNLRQEKTHNLILDGQTVYNLELIDVPYVNNQLGVISLLKYMDRTKSAFGKRMFRKWLLEPLQDVERINERLDAIEDLILNDDLCEIIQGKLSKIQDIERLIHNIYNGGKRNVSHEADFDVYVKPKLHLFVEALKQLREASNMFKFLSDFTGKVKSKRLLQLLNYIDPKNEKDKIHGLFPKIDAILDSMEQMIVVRNDIPMPAPGRDSGYDALLTKAEDIKRQFQAQLEKARKKLNCESISYVHIKQRYELEIPEAIVEGNKKPKEFVPTSKKKGYVRFHSPEIQELVQKLEEVEYGMHKVVWPYLSKCFKILYSHNTLWQQVVSCFSELDCLISLAQLAKTMKVTCRPQLIQQKQKEQVFDLRGVVHPCLALRSLDFVKNNVILENDKKILLITGPNMGGKSTLMRSVCIATIMAQMGSFVPAECFRLTPIDRIFTRIGAQDNIFEGKSTFFLELEETLNIVNEATERSLVIIDELGRGTSTYDGMAIAYAVLKYLSENIDCLAFFATHFHLLLEEFRIFENVATYYMEAEFMHDELVSFLYKFTKGHISNSFGLTVAKMAGLPLELIEKARGKAELMTTEQLNIHNHQKTLRQFNKLVQVIVQAENNDWDVELLFKNSNSERKIVVK